MTPELIHQRAVDASMKILERRKDGGSDVSIADELVRTGRDMDTIMCGFDLANRVTASTEKAKGDCALIARIADLDTQVETQAETIKALWNVNSRQGRRCEIQQRIIDNLNKRNDFLEAQATPTGQAEQHFKGAN
jgi:uncharacterized coiled-coil protein SlyX